MGFTLGCDETAPSKQKLSSLPNKNLARLSRLVNALFIFLPKQRG
jgi:hypothetical protein